MKTLILAQILITLALFNQNHPEPDYFNQPYFQNDSNQLEKIEKADAKYEIKVKGMGYGGYDMFFTALGSQSTKRFSKEKLLVFLTILKKKVIKTRLRVFLILSPHTTS